MAADLIDFFTPSDEGPLRAEKEVVGGSTFYGFARSISATTANPVWLIARETIAGGDTELLWASDEFDQIWDDRVSLFANPPFANDNSILFSGTDDRLVFPNHSTLFDWDGTTVRSFSFWVRTSVTGEQAIMSQQASANGVGWRVTLQSDETNLHVSGGSGGNRVNLASNGLSLSDDNWHHIMWSVTDLTSTVVQADYTLVVDGVDETANVVISTNSLGSPSSSTGVAPLIGVRGATALDYTGFLDEVSFWDLRLTVVEAQTIYNSGVPIDLINAGPQAANLQLWSRNGDNDTFPSITNLGVGGTELDMTMTSMKASDIVGEVP